MTSREIIKRNLEFRDPQRIGFNFTGERLNDFCVARLDLSKIFYQHRWVEGNVEYYDDVWGNIWFRMVHMSSRGEIYKPALENWSMLKDFKLPDLAGFERFKRAKEVFAEDNVHYHLAALPGFTFAICRYLRKMEIYFQDLILERKNIDELHERVTSLLEKVIKGFADAGADGIFFAEDWGGENRLLINPQMWRDIFKPLYVRLCDTAHSAELHVLMHSCGYNWDILDDLAEVGVNCFQFDQPAVYHLERLAEKLQNLKVCLYSPVDIQKVLPTGNRTFIINEAQRMVRLFCGEHGGFIAKSYRDLKGIGVNPEWDQWAYESFLKNKDLAVKK